MNCYLCNKPATTTIVNEFDGSIVYVHYYCVFDFFRKHLAEESQRDLDSNRREKEIELNKAVSRIFMGINNDERGIE